ncbi:RNA polymerase subunit sigma-24, partial [Micromonospora chersina]
LIPRVVGAARTALYWVPSAARGRGLNRLAGRYTGGRGGGPRHAGVIETVASFDVTDGRVTRIWVVRNPEKLRPWG